MPCGMEAAIFPSPCRGAGYRKAEGRKMKKAQDLWFSIFDAGYDRALRSRLLHTDFSLFTSNCMAGHIYHRLGVQFQSPTINLFMNDHDYFRFICNLEYYLRQDLAEHGVSDEGRPMGLLGDIPITFVHYASFAEGRDALNRIKDRINRQRMFFILYDTVDGEISEEDIAAFGKLDCANRIVLSKRSYPAYDYVLTIPVRPNDVNRH